MKTLQLNIPFGLSPGTEPYFDEILNKQEEICKGGLVFSIGRKDDCRDCARTCAGCLEMAVNLGFSEFNDVKHLIYNPEMLSPNYRFLYEQYKYQKLTS